MKTESILLDIDGTLWDSRGLVARGWNRELVAAGYPELQVDPPRLAQLFGRTIAEIARLQLGSVPEPERSRLMDRCLAAEHEILASDPCRIGYPGVRETLASLHQCHRLYLVSNCEASYPALVMEKLGIREYLSGSLCFGQTGTCKGQTILRLMKEEHITSAVYVGDTQGDLEASEMAGIPFIWAAYGFGAPARWDARLERFSQLPSLVE